MTEDVDFGVDEMQEIIGDFLIEADELVDSLDTNLVKLEEADDDLDLLNEIFRAAHTIKGTSSFLGFDQVTNLTHRMEDILNKLRKSELKVTPEIMDVLLESVDILKLLMEDVRNSTGETRNLDGIIARLEKEDAGGSQSGTTEDKPKESVDATLGEVAEEPTVEEATPSDEQTSSAQPKSADNAPKATRKINVDQTIRVDVNRLDTLMNMMGELVLGRNSLQQSVSKLNVVNEGSMELEALNHSAKSVNFITTELQMAVMKMRMQPIGKVFTKFPRLVRDLSRDSKKQIELIMEGEATELDRSVIEEIGDPLVHIIRNSCDHGIESPDDRTAKGKPAKGTITLSASQEGSNIIIKIEDDGKGLDVKAIRAKAVEHGLATKEAVEQMPDREVFRYIFNAGFSTAKQVTGVSGRGVGMDVVRTNIEKLSGLIELESEVDVGTTITIKLPLTLAIIQGLLVKSEEDVFIVPLGSVHETVKSDQSDIYYVNQRPVLRLRDEIIPIINLNEVLECDVHGFVMSEKPYIVILGLADQKLGIMIDKFLGQEEVVIKSLGSYLGQTEGIAGATILGDGRIRLIVDLIGLFNIARKLN